jgi:hypothetical protein
LHILRAQNGSEYRFYELTGDLPDALHFRHFETTKIHISERKIDGRVRIKDSVKLQDVPAHAASGRVKLGS